MSKETVKATVQYGNKTIMFEGPAAFVESQVAKYSKGDMEDEKQVTAMSSYESITHSQESATERQIILDKKPKNHPETVAVLAFFLTEAGQNQFTDEDIRKAYIRSGVRPPKVVAQAIRDAKNVHDFIEPGSERGTY